MSWQLPAALLLCVLLETEAASQSLPGARESVEVYGTPYDLDSAQPGRALLEQVDMSPGWLFEANNVLHPRESEYQTLFLIDGVPHTENLSPGFAPPPDGSSLVLTGIETAGFPASDGRSLGGVVRVAAADDERPGLHGLASFSGGSQANLDGDLQLSGRGALIEGGGITSSRFLDPPSLANYTNYGHAQHLRADDLQHVGSWDLHLNFDLARQRNEVPNEEVQQDAGQFQHQTAASSDGGVQFSREWVVRAIRRFQINYSFLATDATFDSNSSSTPIVLNQDRGFLQHYARLSVEGDSTHHHWSLGSDTLARKVRERFGYVITDPTQFDDGTQGSLGLSETAWDVEPALFVDDTYRRGGLTARLGLRFDSYSFVIRSHGWSPRGGFSYSFGRHLSAHASYDRVFQTPAVENLLLASSSEVQTLSSFVERVPVPIGHGNFYETGFSVRDFGPQRVPLTLRYSLWLRKWHNFEDDDTLLNTGVSIPFTDRSANVHGQEVTLGVSQPSGHVFGTIAYTNMVGYARGPITGGLLLGQEGAASLASFDSFAISQDQRNTLRAQGIWRINTRFSLSSSLQFNSGLPIELDGDAGSAPSLSRYVNLNRGRVLPWTSSSVGGGYVLWKTGRIAASVRATVDNLGDGVHVINYASLFSGTAIAPGRTILGGMRMSW